MKEAYRSFKVWEEAISLSQLVHTLIESLPADEQSALVASLNAAAVDIPTTAAVNLIQMQPADARDLIRLQTQLELIERIYPALDTAEVVEAASQLLARLLDPNRFREMIPQPEPEEPEESEAEEPAEEPENPDSSQNEPPDAQPAEAEPAEVKHVDVQT